MKNLMTIVDKLGNRQVMTISGDADKLDVDTLMGYINAQGKVKLKKQRILWMNQHQWVGEEYIYVEQ